MFTILYRNRTRTIHAHARHRVLRATTHESNVIRRHADTHGRVGYALRLMLRLYDYTAMSQSPNQPESRAQCRDRASLGETDETARATHRSSSRITRIVAARVPRPRHSWRLTTRDVILIAAAAHP